MNQNNTIWLIGIFLFVYGIYSVSKLGITMNDQLAQQRLIRLAMFQAHTMSSEAIQENTGIIDLDKLKVTPQFTYDIAYGVYDPEIKTFVKHNNVGLMGSEESSFYAQITGLNRVGFKLPRYSQVYNSKSEINPYKTNFAIYTLPITYKSGNSNKYGVLVVVLYPKEIDLSEFTDTSKKLNELLISVKK